MASGQQEGKVTFAAPAALQFESKRGTSTSVELEFSCEAQMRMLFRSALRKLSRQLCTVVARLLQGIFGVEWKSQSAQSLKERWKERSLERVHFVDQGTLSLFYLVEILKHFRGEFAEFCSSGGLCDFKAVYVTPTLCSFPQWAIVPSVEYYGWISLLQVPYPRGHLLPSPGGCTCASRGHQLGGEGHRQLASGS